MASSLLPLTFPLVDTICGLDLLLLSMLALSHLCVARLLHSSPFLERRSDSRLTLSDSIWQ